MQYLIAEKRISFSTDSAEILEQFERFRVREERGECTKLEMGSLAEFRAKYVHLSAKQCELLLSMQMFAKSAACHKKLLMHAVTVVVDNEGYVIAGKPGTGKSTMARQWLDHFGGRSFILSDDRTVAGIKERQAAGWMTPWSKVSHGDPFRAYKVNGIAFISKSKDCAMRRMNREEAVERIRDDYPEEYRRLAGEVADDLCRIVRVIAVQSNIADLDVEKMYRMMKE